MAVEFIPYKPWHAIQMDWIDKDEFEGCLRRSPQYFQLLMMDEPWTMVRGDEILAIVLTKEMMAHHLYVNLFMGKAIQKNFDKEIYKTMKDFIARVTATYDRVSGEAKASNEKLNKMMTWLGFEKEGLMRKYGDNKEDYYMYAIIREDD